jgi:hypothetical protein
MGAIDAAAAAGTPDVCVSDYPAPARREKSLEGDGPGCERGRLPAAPASDGFKRLTGGLKVVMPTRLCSASLCSPVWALPELPAGSRVADLLSR